VPIFQAAGFLPRRGKMASEPALSCPLQYRWMRLAAAWWRRFDESGGWSYGHSPPWTSRQPAGGDRIARRCGQCPYRVCRFREGGGL